MPDLLKPVIVAINGHAIGAAFEKLMVADFVIAANHAEFWLPKAQRGIPPEIASDTLPRMLPRQRAMQILMTGRHLSAQELVSYGLINEVVPAAQVMASARSLAAELTPAAPLALAAHWLDPAAVRYFKARFRNVYWSGEPLTYRLTVADKYRDDASGHRMLELTLNCTHNENDPAVDAWMTLDFGA